MKNGVPFSVLFDVAQLMHHEMEAMSIVMSQLEGGVFNWDSWEWEKPE